VESNRLGGIEHSDFWWRWADAKSSSLAPLNGAKAVVVMSQDFERINAKYLERVELSQKQIEGGVLKPGAIVVFRTPIMPPHRSCSTGSFNVKTTPAAAPRASAQMLPGRKPWTKNAPPLAPVHPHPCWTSIWLSI